jgi:uncharacterized protein YecE (DUF72 family)
MVLRTTTNHENSRSVPVENKRPIIFQFPFFSRSVFPDRHAFTDRLIPFLKKLPANHKFGIEIPNRYWLDAEFANLLRDHQIALVLQDRSWMPDPQQLPFDPITADWTYIRWAVSPVYEKHRRPCVRTS